MVMDLKILKKKKKKKKKKCDIWEFLQNWRVSIGHIFQFEQFQG